MADKTKTVDVTAYPYAVIEGTIEVPKDVDVTRDYLIEHFDEIKFDEPQLDFCGTDFEFHTGA